MSFAEPNNLKTLQRLPEGAQKQYERLHAAVEAIDRKSPDRDKPVFTRFLHDSIIDLQHQAQYHKKAENAALRGDRATVEKMRREAANEHANFANRFARDVAPKFGAEGMKDYRDLSNESNKTIGGGILSSFYDSSRNGWQISGLIGGVLGGMLLNTLTGGAGGWFGWLAVLAGVVAGGWLGNQASNAISGYTDGGNKSPSPDGTSKTVEKPLDPAAQKRREASNALAQQLAAEERRKAEEKGVSGGLNVDDKNSAQLPGQNTPVTQPADKTPTTQPER